MQAFRFEARQGAPEMDLLPPERSARSRSPAFSAARRADVVDAEFETVSVRRPVHRVFNDNRAAAGVYRRPAVVADSRQMRVSGLLLAMLSEATAHCEGMLRRASPMAFVGLVAGLCGIVFLVVAGMAGNNAEGTFARGLAISDVTTRLGDANGMRVISVYGTIENHTSELQIVPVIEIDVETDGRAMTATRILSGASILAPGESRPFAARLPYAGGKLPEVTVSFGKPDALAH